MPSLIRPKTIAKPHITMPAIEEVLDEFGLALIAAITLTINPTAAKGILIQLYAPRHGMKPISIPITESIPQIRLIICMICIF